MLLERFIMNYIVSGLHDELKLFPVCELVTDKDTYHVAGTDYSVNDKYTITSSVLDHELLGLQNPEASSILLKESRLRTAYNQLIKALEYSQRQYMLNSKLYHQDHCIDYKIMNDSNLSFLANLKNALLFGINKIFMKNGVQPNILIISRNVYDILHASIDFTALLNEFPHITNIIISDPNTSDPEHNELDWWNCALLAYAPPLLLSYDLVKTKSYGVTMRKPLLSDHFRNYHTDNVNFTEADESLKLIITNYDSGFLFTNIR